MSSIFLPTSPRPLTMLNTPDRQAGFVHRLGEDMGLRCAHPAGLDHVVQPTARAVTSLPQIRAEIAVPRADRSDDAASAAATSPRLRQRFA